MEMWCDPTGYQAKCLQRTLKLNSKKVRNNSYRNESNAALNFPTLEKKHQWHFVAWLYGQLCNFHSCFSLRFHCSKNLQWPQQSVCSLLVYVSLSHVTQPTHLSQLASTSSLFPLKQEAGDEKVSHICKIRPPALLIVSFSLEAKMWLNFLFLLSVSVDCLA